MIPKSKKDTFRFIWKDYSEDFWGTFWMAWEDESTPLLLRWTILPFLVLPIVWTMLVPLASIGSWVKADIKHRIHGADRFIEKL